MKYIITGQLGLIGSPLKRRLDSLGHKCVYQIDKKYDNIQLVENLIDEKMRKADIVFHLADNCKINKCIDNPELAFENVRSIIAILEMCRRNNIKKLVYFSSSRVLSEEKNPYTAGKIYGEELCKAYYKCYGIEYIIIRPSTVYGGEDHTNRLMNIWINNALEGKNLEIYGDSSKTLSFTYIKDFIDAVIDSLKKWNRAYNIAGDEEYVYDVATEIIKQTNSKSKIVIKPSELEQPQKVNIKSDFACKTSIKKGIAKELKR